MVVSKQKLIETINTLSSYGREITEQDYITQHSLLFRQTIEEGLKLYGSKSGWENFITLPQLNFNWILNSKVDDNIKSYIIYLREISDEYRKEFFSLKSKGYVNEYALKSNIADNLISTFHLFMCFDSEYFDLSIFRKGFRDSTMLILRPDDSDEELFKMVLPDYELSTDNQIDIVKKDIQRVLNEYNVKKYTLNIGKQQLTFAYNDYNNKWESYEYGEQYV